MAVAARTAEDSRGASPASVAPMPAATLIEIERVSTVYANGTVALADVVDSGHVRMGQRRRGACLGQEASPALVVGIGWQHLERDLAIEPRVTREEHLAHAASAQRRQDFIGTEMTCAAHGRVQCRPLSGQRPRDARGDPPA